MKYSNKPILDEEARRTLSKNTKRKIGISDIPKELEERSKADPGYGLPKLKMTQTARIKEDKIIQHKDKVI